MDFNELERVAQTYINAGQLERAVSIYAWMATGDPSLDGGYLGERLGECYEQLGQPFVARFWYNRAVEENPEVRITARNALTRLDRLEVAELIPNWASTACEN